MKDLWISKSEVKTILQGLQEFNKIYVLTAMKKTSKRYKVILGDITTKEIEYIKFYKKDLLNLIEAPLGLKTRLDSKEIDEDVKFRVQLKKVEEDWEIDK